MSDRPGWRRALSVLLEEWGDEGADLSRHPELLTKRRLDDAARLRWLAVMSAVDEEIADVVDVHLRLNTETGRVELGVLQTMCEYFSVAGGWADSLPLPGDFSDRFLPSALDELQADIL